jgi:hypothetical protein
MARRSATTSSLTSSCVTIRETSLTESHSRGPKSTNQVGHMR